MTRPPQGSGADETRLGSADELEQRQRPDGSWEEPDVVAGDVSRPLDPDEVEQRQRLDGGVERGAVEDSSDEPLTADELEQRQTVSVDDLDDEDRPAE